MKKRILNIILCISMLLTLVPFTVSNAATGAELKITASKTSVNAGDTVTYTVSIGAIKNLTSMEFKLVIPSGLTYVTGSGKAVSGLAAKLGADKAELTESTMKFVIYGDGAYTSSSATTLMTFQCKVDSKAAVGSKYEITFASGIDIGDSNYDLIEFYTTTSTSVVTVEAPKVDLTIKADKTTAYAGGTVTYTVSIGAVKDLRSAEFKLVIPSGLTYVTGSGKAVSGLAAKLGADKAELTESTMKFVIYGDGAYTSSSATTLMTFQCKVDSKASIGSKYTITFASGIDVGNTEYDKINVNEITSPSTVTVVEAPKRNAEITVKSDKATAYAGDTVTYTVSVGAVTGLRSGEFKLSIPSGLTYVTGSGKVTDGLASKLGASKAEFTESTLKFAISGDGNYTSSSSTTLMTFKCKVDSGAIVGNTYTVTLTGADFGDENLNKFNLTLNTSGAKVKVAEKEKVLNGIKIGKTTLSLGTKDTEKLTFTVDPSDLSGVTAKWSSDKTSVATVGSDGTVTAIAPGTAKITLTVTYNGVTKTATCTVTVTCKHNGGYNTFAAKESTCIAQGNNVYYQCKTCGKYFSDLALTKETTPNAQKLPLGPHKGTKYARTEAVKGKDGYEEYYKCSVCGKMFSDSGCTAVISEPTVLHFRGYGYNDTAHWYECVNCHTKLGSNESHSMQWIVDKPATTTEFGVKHEECIICGYKTSLNTRIDKEVEPVRVIDSVSLDAQTVTIGIGKTKKLTYKIMPADFDMSGVTLIWSTTDPTVVTIDQDGNITGVGMGEATINLIAISGGVMKKTSSTVKVVCEHSGGVNTFAAIGSNCLTEGRNAYYQCKVCNKYFSDTAMTKETTPDKEKLPLGPHTPVRNARVEAVKGKDGHELYYACSVCGKLFRDQACTAPIDQPTVLHYQGYAYDSDSHWYECVNCHTRLGENESHELIWKVDKAATTTATGKKHQECEICGYKTNENTVIEKLSHVHDMQKQNEVPATNKADGYKAHYLCASCNKRYLDKDGLNEVTLADLVLHYFGNDWKKDNSGHWHECVNCGTKSKVSKHDLKWVTDKAATSEESGLQHQECKVCAYVTSQNTVIPKLDHVHKFDKHEKVEPTHVKDGNIEYYSCNVCGRIYTDNQGKKEIAIEDTILHMLGHSFGKYMYNETVHYRECPCGEISDENSHQLGEWTIKVKATESKKGVRERTCQTCDYTETEDIEARGGNGEEYDCGHWPYIIALIIYGALATAALIFFIFLYKREKDDDDQNNGSRGRRRY